MILINYSLEDSTNQFALTERKGMDLKSIIGTSQKGTATFLMTPSFTLKKSCLNHYWDYGGKLIPMNYNHSGLPHPKIELYINLNPEEEPARLHSISSTIDPCQWNRNTWS